MRASWGSTWGESSPLLKLTSIQLPHTHRPQQFCCSGSVAEVAAELGAFFFFSSSFSLDGWVTGCVHVEQYGGRTEEE